MTGAVLGVDPGSAKAGYALVEPDGTVVRSGIVAVDALAETLAALAGGRPIACVALGRGTRSAQVASALQPLGIPIVLIDEFETSRRARELYFKEHPPRGWRRLIPPGMQLPPRPVDDYAAVLIARSYLTRAGGVDAPN